MHELGGKEDGAAGGHRGLAEHIFQEDIEDGQHKHPQQGAGEPPAEGGHAEDTDAQADEELAQGRVGHLIGVHPVHVLLGGAGVVDLVKVGGVEPVGLFRYVGGVKKGGEGLLDGLVRDRPLEVHRLSVLPQEAEFGQLKQPLVRLAGDTQVPDVLGGAHRHIDPLEKLVVVLGQGVAGGIALGVGPVVARHLFGVVGVLLPLPEGRPVVAVRGDLYVVAPGAQPGEVADPGGQEGLPLHPDQQGVPAAEVHRGLGGREAAQPEKGGAGVEKGDEEQDDPVLFAYPVAGAGKAQGLVLPLDPQKVGGTAVQGHKIPRQEIDDTAQHSQGKENGRGDITHDGASLAGK